MTIQTDFIAGRAGIARRSYIHYVSEVSPRDVFEVEGECFEGDGSSITGVGLYEYETEAFYDRDIGGSDGLEVTRCELIGMQLDGLLLSRDQILQIATTSDVAAAENAARELIEAEI